MVNIERLRISGYRNDQVPNSFFRQAGGSDHLAIVLPGLSYRCNQPLLWYPTRALLSSGADVLWVEYAYDLQPDWVVADDQVQRDWLFDDVVAATRSAMETKYERVTLVGKSMGTIALGHVLRTEKIPDRRKAVWLTPVLDDPALRRQLVESNLPSLIVIGSKDNYYDGSFLERLQSKKSFEVEVIKGADHILETDEGTLASIDIMRQVMNSFQRFISEWDP
ncbi:MAG: hypothetical protein JRM77_07295 [Nitrososphaerota archaeon]|nr:hypothetical protein [Nitrososphaerota archaeon]